MQSLDIVSVLPDIQSAPGHLALGLQLRGTAGERTRCGRGCATCMSHTDENLASMKTTESAMNLQLLRHRVVLWSTVLVLLPVPRLPVQQQQH